MNIALIMKLLDGLLATKPGSKGRKENFTRVALLGICSTILFHTSKIPELDKRLAVVEARLGLPRVTGQAVTGPGSVTPAASLTNFAAVFAHQ